MEVLRQFVGRRWIRRFRGGAIATMRVAEGGNLHVEWSGQLPHRRQKARRRLIISEYLGWKRTILQELANDAGCSVLDVTIADDDETVEAIVKPEGEE